MTSVSTLKILNNLGYKFSKIPFWTASFSEKIPQWFTPIEKLPLPV